MLRFAVLLTGRQDQAEDLVQDAFVRAASRLPSIDAGDARPYLRATVLNLWRKRLRRLVLERKTRQQPLPRAELAFEERDELWGAIRRLPSRRRACLVLRFYEDLTERETAELLGCSIGTVKSQTHKALQSLRQELSHED
ncbi:MAG: SigE family RNA polymerase sigma factor [Actinomycetota bacterium]|nr:SigE family RNA polymerase sigma factor [Actinomycetota bacterium]